VEKLMYALEKDRENKFGELGERLNKAANVTKELMETTQDLRQALSGTKSRGNWGERMAEDVLKLAGLIEGINYQKQKKWRPGAKRRISPFCSRKVWSSTWMPSFRLITTNGTSMHPMTRKKMPT
jgi:hypothetical protein